MCAGDYCLERHMRGQDWYLGLCAVGLLACQDDSKLARSENAAMISAALSEPQSDPGSLVATTMDSRVGVLLDELPASVRNRVASALIAKPASFWINRARSQVRLTGYRLVFREFFYGWNGGYRHQLPLPPEDIWNISLTGAAVRTTVNGHDLVVVPYRFSSTILSDANSPGVSENALQHVGGTWDEPFSFPIDPELLYQRTGYACMDEADFPLDTVDSEEVDTYYDQTCTVEKELTSILCHQTEMPTESCLQALDNHVGRIDTALHYERLAWNATLANSVRVYSPTSETADLLVYQEDFHQNRIEYKYFAPDACELEEKCIGAPGWRRVLQFNSSDQNRGKKTIEIGDVDYYFTGKTTLNDQYHIFEKSQCHGHYHFTHYGSFSFDAPGAATTTKQGFCLQSTARTANHEFSPLPNPYGGCDFQGVEAGWADQYKIGLPCQFVDITNVDTSRKPVSGNLTFTSNPDGFVCEGTPELDANGNPVFEPTEFRTDAGEVVYRPKCTFSPGALTNNVDSYQVTVPKPGETYVNGACTRGQIGHRRNCGWTPSVNQLNCSPGSTVRMRCSIASNAAPQVVRVCERSAKLNTSPACIDRRALASQPVETTKDFSFTCPAPRPDGEPGGQVSLFTGAAFPEDAAATVSCTVL